MTLEQNNVLPYNVLQCPTMCYNVSTMSEWLYNVRMALYCCLVLTSRGSQNRSVSDLQSILKASAEDEAGALRTQFGTKFDTRGMAVKGSVMWNLIFTPAENSAALLPVSRDWSFAPNPVNDDWTYAIFDW